MNKRELLRREKALQEKIARDFTDVATTATLLTDRQWWGVASFGAQHGIPPQAVIRIAVALFLEDKEWKGTETWHWWSKRDLYEAEVRESGVGIPFEEWEKDVWTHRRRGWDQGDDGE